MAAIEKFIEKTIKIFVGDKKKRDIKSLAPIVDKVNEQHEKIKLLTNDQLREKTFEFKNIIINETKSINKEITSYEQKIKSLNTSLEEKQSLFEKITKLQKQELEIIETVLSEIYPEVFSVLKEVCYRFTSNNTLSLKAFENDRHIAANHDYVSISGDQAIYNNSWMAAGSEIIWNMVHYDVQLMGGLVLHQGKIAEMQTGEGKTLVATLSLYLNALSGKGVHLVTVNNYLAKRDSEWMGTIFQFLGLTIDCIDKYPPHSEERKQAYQADITYGTNNEFGFDYLRDNMCSNPEELVQKKHHFAIVDEVDSVLIDDARTPLIISGPTPKGDEHEFTELKPKVEKLIKAQKDHVSNYLIDAKKILTPIIKGEKVEKKEQEKGALALFRSYRGLPKNKPLIKFLSEQGIKSILQKTENFHLQENSKEMPNADKELYFTIDEKSNSVDLTDKGINLITDNSDDEDFFILPDVGLEIEKITNHPDLSKTEKLKLKDELTKSYTIKAERIHTINQLLKAYTMFEKDVEYVVMNNQVQLVDEQTGRIMDGRRYSDGLHQAIEAKENVKIEAATQTYATITLQNYFRMYHKLSGMTGTAETEAQEFWDIYKLDVVAIPTNEPVIREDKEDKVYKTAREKFNAIIEEITEIVKNNRPVLVGTTSVEISELLSKMLKLRKIKHNVLNAKLHQKEAEIISHAGQSSVVTIATNMAGRGTDIKLSEESKNSGGLAIIGTERHDSRRVDRQLRGRSGRQGDPGSSQFFVSLEDNLMRLFNSERMIKLMDRLGHQDGDVIQHKLITKSIERAQKKVEENNFGVRKRLLEYDDIMNSQREVIYTKRRNTLFGKKIGIELANMTADVIEEITNLYIKEHKDIQQLQIDLLNYLGISIEINKESNDFNYLANQINNEVKKHYHFKSKEIQEFITPVISRMKSEESSNFEYVSIPFTDQTKTIMVGCNIDKVIETKGESIIQDAEKQVLLSIIDEKWKNHLREMDELKQSVQNASYEQKDPLLIFKIEAFNLFEKTLSQINHTVVSFIQKMHVVPKEERLKTISSSSKSDFKNLETSRENIDFEGNGNNLNDKESDKPKKQPVKVERKVGRNESCPCGSGKKYKQCHGKS